MKKPLLGIFRNPYIITLLATIIFIPFLPLKTQRYKLELFSTIMSTDINNVFYYDLDLDGVSEEISFIDKVNASGVMIQNPNNFIEQWNIRGTFDFYQKHRRFHIIGDYNNDGLKEIYFFSISADSIFLHSIPNFRKSEFGIKNRFLTKVGLGKKKPDPTIITAEMQDLNGDGKKELIFGISTGFSLFPRNLYAYFVDKDSLVISDHSCAQISGILQADIDNDGVKEIIPHISATSNCDTTIHILHDHSCWLQILNNNLKPKYNIKEFTGRYSALTPFYFICKEKKIFGTYHRIREPNRNSKLAILDSAGCIIRSTEISNGGGLSFLTKDRKGNCELVVSRSDGILLVFDESLKLKRSLNLKNPTALLKKVDLDGDGKKELVFYSPVDRMVSVYREGLRNPVNLLLPHDERSISFSGFLKKDKDYSIFAVSGKENIFNLDYRKNKTFFLKYAIIPSIYLIFLIFSIIIQKTQRVKYEERLQTERKISKLQLSHIRNQIDPHFTLNVLNNISSVFITGNKELAIKYYIRFTSLIRQVLTKSDDLLVDLNEEMVFIENYLEIERLRLNNGLRYEINITNEIKKQFKLPKMLIFTFVENAIKHGLFHLKKEKFLSISMYEKEESLLVIIEDNGIGRAKAKRINTSGTKRGLNIVDQIIDIHKKLYNNHISYYMEDANTLSKENCGTKVTIEISQTTS